MFRSGVALACLFFAVTAHAQATTGELWGVVL